MNGCFPEPASPFSHHSFNLYTRSARAQFTSSQLLSGYATTLAAQPLRLPTHLRLRASGLSNDQRNESILGVISVACCEGTCIRKSGGGRWETPHSHRPQRRRLKRRLRPRACGHDTLIVGGHFSDRDLDLLENYVSR